MSSAPKSASSTPKLPPHSSNLVHLEQSHLPHLPIPSLEQTFTRYLSVVKPLFLSDVEDRVDNPEDNVKRNETTHNTQQETPAVHENSPLVKKTRSTPSVPNAAYERTQQIVYDFVHGPRKEGPNLDRELRQLAQQSPHFLEGFWNSMYLEQRDPVIINTSPYFKLRLDGTRVDQCARAANLLLGTVHYARIIINNELPEYMRYEISRTRGSNEVTRTELCLSQFHWVLSSTIARYGRDYLKSTVHSRYAIVLCRHQYYKVELYNGDSPRTEQQLYNELTQILKDAQQTQKHQILPVGALTTANRDLWAGARDAMMSDSLNRASLAAIDDALILVILDETAPTDWEDIARLGMHSDGRNVWLDKSLSVTVCQNGETAVTMNHAGFDGDVFNSWARYVTEYAERTPVPPLDSAFEYIRINKMRWNLTKPVIKLIKQSERAVDEFIDLIDISVLQFTQFGKNEIKRLGVSPDAFVQMAFQLTYFRLFRKTVSTYEPMNVRRFLHGRTTTVRVQSKASRKFTLCFTDPLTSVHDKSESLRRACQVHQDQIKRSKAGHGVDRHLYGMLCLARHNVQKLPGYELPALFQDEAFRRLRTDLMSTSNSSGVPGLVLQGFGPVCAEGFGLGYIQHDEEMTISISNFKKKSSMFKDVLRQSLVDMRRVLEADMKSNKSGQVTSKM